MNINGLLSQAQPIPESGCFIWEGYTNEKGYGRTLHEGKYWLTHRLSWYLTHGDCPDTKMVCHKCDVPSCINPDHLFLGTAQENNDDRDRKGRWWTPKGEEHGMAKLSESDVIDIRQCLKDGVPYELISQGWHISKPMVGMIKNGHNWKHLGGKIYTFHDLDDDELLAELSLSHTQASPYGEGPLRLVNDPTLGIILVGIPPALDGDLLPASQGSYWRRVLAIYESLKRFLLGLAASMRGNL